LREH
jgi:hypothetical protein